MDVNALLAGPGCPHHRLWPRHGARATLLDVFQNFGWSARNGQKAGERFNSWILS
jgi:hypothetical protein